jgi:hypothetical protein
VATAPVEQRVRQLVTILRAPDLYVVKSSQVQYREYKDWTGDPMHSTECEDSTASLPRETRERLLRLRTDKARGSVDQLHPLIVLLLLLLLLFLLLVTANRRGERVGWKGRSDKQRISRLTAGADPGREEP